MPLNVYKYTQSIYPIYEKNTKVQYILSKDFHVPSHDIINSTYSASSILYQLVWFKVIKRTWR